MTAKTNLKTSVLVAAFSLAMLGIVQAHTITVGPGVGYEFDTIQAGINAAGEGDTVIVAEGIYNENINFIGTNITLTSTEPNDPVVVAGTVIRGDGTTSVLIFSGSEDASCELRGFTITGGHVLKPRYGGGIRGNGTMATISHCIISANTSEQHGGGLYGCNGLISNCTITGNRTRSGGGLCRCNGWIRNCIISDNRAHSGGGLSECYGQITNCIITDNRTEAGGGGLMWCGEINECTISGNIGSGVLMCSSISNCVITGNTGCHGGGISASSSVNNCVIIGNVAYGGGGVSGCNSISNCTIIGNKAEFGGGIFCTNISSTITNCTISNNRAKTDGGGIYCWGIDATVSNCIIWGDTAPQGDEIALFSYCVCCVTGCICYPSSITVSYSDVQGGSAGVYMSTDVYMPDCTLNWEAGNIDADPCFVDPGYWDANGLWIDGDYHLPPDSPCIDAGDPNHQYDPNEIDLDGKPRVIGGRIDMGAFEYSGPLPAELRIVPRTINLASKGRWITCYIWLPEGYDVTDIDPNSVLLEDEIEPRWVWFDEEEQVAMVRFSREQAQAILDIGDVELTITGQLTDGTTFEGTDVIIVINKGSRKSATCTRVTAGTSK